jgi:hypothetical protein
VHLSFSHAVSWSTTNHSSRLVLKYQKGVSFFLEGIILSQSIMPQLDSFTFFTQILVLCLIFLFIVLFFVILVSIVILIFSIKRILSEHAAWFHKTDLINKIIEHNSQPKANILIGLEFSLWSFRIIPIRAHRESEKTDMSNEKSG